MRLWRVVLDLEAPAGWDIGQVADATRHAMHAVRPHLIITWQAVYEGDKTIIYPVLPGESQAGHDDRQPPPHHN